MCVWGGGGGERERKGWESEKGKRRVRGGTLIECDQLAQRLPFVQL